MTALGIAHNSNACATSDVAADKGDVKRRHRDRQLAPGKPDQDPDAEQCRPPAAGVTGSDRLDGGNAWRLECRQQHQQNKGRRVKVTGWRPSRDTGSTISAAS